MRTFGAYKELVEQSWSLLNVQSGRLGLAVREDEDGHWAGLVWPAASLACGGCQNHLDPWSSSEPELHRSWRR